MLYFKKERDKLVRQYLIHSPRIFFLLMLVFGLILLNCGEMVPTQELRQTDFQLNFPNIEPELYFSKVVDIDISTNGEIFLVDVDKAAIFRFDVKGNALGDISGRGTGRYDALCSVNLFDTLVASHTLGSLELLSRSGVHKKHFLLEGGGDVSCAPDGRYVMNRMHDSHKLGHCLETYDKTGKLLKRFRNSRMGNTEESFMDFSFSRATPDGQIVYVPTLLDTVSMYDFDGNLLLSKVLKSIAKPFKIEEKDYETSVEDVFVNSDGIFIARIDPEKSTEQKVYVNLIEQYDFNLEYVKAYKLPESISMTVPPVFYAPWYHNFAVKDGKFYFVVTEDYQKLVVYE